MFFCTCATRDVSNEQPRSFLLCVICGHKYHITCTNVTTDDLNHNWLCHQCFVNNLPFADDDDSMDNNVD